MSGALLTYGETLVLTVLRGALTTILPPGVPVIRAEVNRTAEPEQNDWVEMTPTLRRRISTNIDTFADIYLQGSINGTDLFIADLQGGTLEVGQYLTGPPALVPNTFISSGSGPTNVFFAGPTVTFAGAPVQFGSSDFQVSQNQTLTGTFYAGIRNIEQDTEITTQIDVHGPNSADNAEIISTVLRDGYACELFSDQAIALLGTDSLSIAPLYVGEPRQVPFLNAEQQYEFRWTLDVVVEANQVVTVQQQFAATLTASTTIVDIIF